MNTFTNQKLYNISVLNSIKLESIKLYEFKARNNIFLKLRNDLESLLSGIKYTNLSDLTKKQFDKLVSEVDKLHNGFYSTISDDLVKMFDKFVNVKLKASKKEAKPVLIENETNFTINNDGEVDIDNYIEDLKKDGVFPYALLISFTLLAELLKNKEITGVGYSFSNLLDSYNTYSRGKLIDPIKRAYFTGFTIDELKRELLGDPKVLQGFKGNVNGIQASLNSIIDTSLGFAAVNIEAGVYSALITNSYIWVSIMDTKTSAICTDRNRKIYQYGKGPLPPAHMRCRSSISPLITNNGSVEPNSFKTWIDKQVENIDKTIKKYGIINNDGSYKATKALNMDDLTK